MHDFCQRKICKISLPYLLKTTLFNGLSSRSTRLSQHQTSQTDTSPTVTTFIITMILFSSYQFPPLQPSARDTRKCKLIKSLSTLVSVQLSAGLPQGRAPSTACHKPNIFLPSHPHPFLKYAHTILNYFAMILYNNLFL